MLLKYTYYFVYKVGVRKMYKRKYVIKNYGTYSTE